MATPQSLEEIIRKECLPLRDCMLTITDSNGEAAFLYFKEGELIEANYAALWGKDALAQIVTWKLAERTVAPAPLIKLLHNHWDRSNAQSGRAHGQRRTPILPAFNAQKMGHQPVWSLGHLRSSQLVQIRRTKLPSSMRIHTG